jgi:hypothetical protein
VTTISEMLHFLEPLTLTKVCSKQHHRLKVDLTGGETRHVVWRRLGSRLRTAVDDGADKGDAVVGEVDGGAIGVDDGCEPEGLVLEIGVRKAGGRMVEEGFEGL